MRNLKRQGDEHQVYNAKIGSQQQWNDSFTTHETYNANSGNHLPVEQGPEVCPTLGFQKSAH
eukprot:1158431-Pelagomonas_calceolata.AAC.3